MYPNQASPALHNQPHSYEAGSRPQPVAEIVSGFLADGRINEQLPPRWRGVAIAALTTGALIAQYDKGAFSAARYPTNSSQEVLHAVDSTFGGRSADWHDELEYVTSAGGLRGAVQALGEDPRMHGALGNMAGSVKTDETGRPVLTSVAQLQGYVYGLNKGEYASWQAPILEEALRIVNMPAQETPNPRWTQENHRSLMSSELPLVRDSQAVFAEALRAAEAAGLDRQLLDRSARGIRAVAAQTGVLGQVELVNAAPEVTVRHFDGMLGIAPPRP